MENDVKPQVITPPAKLKEKVVAGGPGAVTPEVLEKAEAAISELTGNYLEWVEEDLGKIQEAYEALKPGVGAADNGALDRVFQVSHDIKGQGGSFGYGLMTALGDRLCRLIEGMDQVGENEIEVIKLHIDTMRLVIAKRIQGDGGTMGRKLIEGLDQVVAKLAKG